LRAEFAKSAGQEVADQAGDFGERALQQEMAAAEQMDLRLDGVVGEGSRPGQLKPSADRLMVGRPVVEADAITFRINDVAMQFGRSRIRDSLQTQLAAA